MILDIDRVSQLIREAAEAEILPRFRKLRQEDIREKTGPQDLVTAADIGAEERLTPCLRALVPGSLVVGEEAAFKNPDILQRLTGRELIWIIDPVDGTANFAEGRPDFAVIVAAVRDNQVVAGWIHDVIAGETATAESGEGAWLDGRRLSVARPGAVERMTGALYVGAKRAPRLHARLKTLRTDRRLGQRSYLRSAGSEYLALVRGRSHYALFNRLLPWDHAAGYLIHREAGGFGRGLDGSAYRPWPPSDMPLLLAPDQASWRALVDLFGSSA